MTPEEKMAGVLDRLVNVMVTTKEVKALLIEQGKGDFEQCLEWRHTAAKARNYIHASLMAWVKKNGYYGHGTKKLVDKAVSAILRGYKFALHIALAEDRREEEREAKWQAEYYR